MMLQALFLVLITMIVMEFAVTQFHRYIMHGVGWRWHQSHHAQPKKTEKISTEGRNSAVVYNRHEIGRDSYFQHQAVCRKSNHQKPHLEKNDLYAVIFSVATLCVFIVSAPQSALWWIAIGITLYGLLYALVHDVIVHRRLPVKWQPRNAYIKRLIKAHHLHHAVQGRDNSVSFGFLYAPPLEKLHARLRSLSPAHAHHDPRTQSDARTS